MNDNPPKCSHKRCKYPAMPNSPTCMKHWLKARGWDAKRGEYLPFAEDVDDPDYASDAAYAGDEIAKAS